LEQFAKFLLNAEKARPARRRVFKPTRLSGRDNPLARIIHRFNTHHDHGFTTIIEELFIALGLDVLGSRTWLTMQTFINNSFDASADAGGTAFVDHLCDVVEKEADSPGHVDRS